MIQSFGFWSIPLLLHGLMWTVLLSLTTFVAGGLFGLLFALGRSIGPRWLKLLIAGYIQLVQATPLLILLFLSFYALPFMGWYFPPLAAAAISLTAYSTAFLADIWRGCIEAIPRTQWEAADALALSSTQKLRYVILPQAFRAMVPLLLTQAIILFQDTSIVYVLGLADFFTTASNMGIRDGTVVELVMFAGACYFVVCTAVSTLVKYLQKYRSAGNGPRS